MLNAGQIELRNGPPICTIGRPSVRCRVHRVAVDDFLGQRSSAVRRALAWSGDVAIPPILDA